MRISDWSSDVCSSDLQMQDRGAALDMAEEAVAEAGTLVRAFDQAGHVGQHHLLLVDAADAEAGLQRGERVVGELSSEARRGEKAGDSSCGAGWRPEHLKTTNLSRYTV